MGFARHRLGIDGEGVTTLVAAWGCPLQCRFCLNPQCRDKNTPIKQITPEELFNMAKIDDLYFRATGGGITFGGGEPLLHAEFIRAFRKRYGNDWHLTAETCLYISKKKLSAATECIDTFIVDIKEMNPVIYRRYTGFDNSIVIENLRILVNTVGSERIIVRIPQIPGFNSKKDTENSAEALKKLGIEKTNFFTYKISHEQK